MIANIYCMYIVSLYGKSLHGQDKVRPSLFDRGVRQYKPCVTFSYLFHSFTLGLYSVLGLVFHRGKLY